jgi:hypothetical protein
MGFSLLEGLHSEVYDRIYTDRQILRRIAQVFRPQARWLVEVTVLLVVISLLNALSPLLIQPGSAHCPLL